MEVPSENATTLKADREKKNFCPFGCPIADLDDNGYCHHLVGFTNDGVNVEPVGRMNGHAAVHFIKNPKKRPKVEAGDVLVNPEDNQQIAGVTYVSKRWVSPRVYRNLEKPLEVHEPEQELPPAAHRPERPRHNQPTPDHDRMAALENQVAVLNELLALKAATPKKTAPKKKATKKAEPELAAS